MSVRRREVVLGAAAAAWPAGAAAASGRRPGPFMLGADVTWIAEDEAAGAEYHVGGVRQDPLVILRDAGFNYVRLRTFVNPELGYSRREPASRWGGLEQLIRLGSRVKALGMGLAVSFHYSDTWADPERQIIPARWTGLPTPALAEAIFDYTRDAVRRLRRGGARADMVVIGNETTFGMCWPLGRVPLTVPTGNPVTDATHRNVQGAGGYDGFAALLKAGVAGARDADPRVLVQVHNHLGRHWEIVRAWTDALLERGVPFDVVGLSCYQQAAEGDWERTLAEFVRRYPDKGVLVAEYSSRKRYLNDLVHALPNGRGWGSFIWEPTRHQEAVFDRNGRNAGGGPRPNLISQGMNSAEAPGGGPSPGAAGPPRRMGLGGRYDANAHLDLYRDLAENYGLRTSGSRIPASTGTR